MSNIYLKITIETFSKWFSVFKTFVTRSVFGELLLTQISVNFKTSCCNLKIKGLRAKLCWKRKIPHIVLERWTLCFISYNNHKLKVKAVRSWSLQKKKEGIFCTEGNFLKICVLSRCIVHWIHFQTIYIFTSQKNITSYTFFACF